MKNKEPEEKPKKKLKIFFQDGTQRELIPGENCRHYVMSSATGEIWIFPLEDDTNDYNEQETIFMSRVVGFKQYMLKDKKED